jgi:hypothetical protein
MSKHAKIILLAAGVPLLTACGSSSSNSSASAGAAKRSSAIAFAACMRTHGVPNFPDPTGTGGGLQIQASQRAGSGSSLKVNGVPVAAPAFQSAMHACQSKLPNGGHPPAGAAAKARQTALRFAQCMRSHGAPNFPDPQIQSGPGGGIGIRIGGPGVDPNSQAFKSAQTACGSIMGKGFAGGAGVRNGP